MLTTAWVYIVTNKNNTKLNVGVTNDLPTMLWEHRTKQDSGCTAPYGLSKLIFYEGFESNEDAIQRKKYIKYKKRKWKEAFIKTMNAGWSDLTEKISLNIIPPFIF